MLIWTQLTAIFLLTHIVTVNAEKIFHTRDHSDVDVYAPHHAELIVDTDTARQFLSKYGFLKPVRLDESQSKEADYTLNGERLHMRIQEGSSASRAGTETAVSANTPDFISGLRQFQVMSGLPETGVFDDVTKAAMNKPRCGVPDRASPIGSSVKDNSTGLAPTAQAQQPVASNATINITGDQSDRSPKPASPRQKRHLLTLLSKRRPKQEANNLRQIAFSKRLLKWRLIGEGYSSQLSVDDQRYIFKQAFRMWSEVSPLEFVEDVHSPLAEIDIRLGFGTGRHLGCTQAFDGAGQEFAHAWFLGDIHFDDDEHFTAPNTGYGISLLKVAVHEIGHVLGLPHIFRPGSIMRPSYLPQDTGFEIDWLDRKAIQKLYGECRGRFSTVFDWIRKERTPYGEVVVRFNTYFMRGGWYWMYENRNNRTRYGDPVAVQVGWHGVPGNGVDAYVHVWTWTSDAAYFFKGTQYWRYDGENDQVFTEDSEGRRYPRLISEGFPGVPSPIDTAFYDRRDSLIYFFKGKDVYAFHVGTHAVLRGYPKKIKETFPASVPGDHPDAHLDAAYFSYTHDAVFLLKGTRFWRLLSTREQRLKPFLPRNSLLPGKEVDRQWFDICDVHRTNLKMLG